MRAVVIRTSGASLRVNGQDHARIGRGAGGTSGRDPDRREKEATYLAEKCAGLRIFEDENGKLNLSLKDVGGQMLVVSNFTLYADCSHGRRPDFLAAAKPSQSNRCMSFPPGAAAAGGAFGKRRLWRRYADRSCERRAGDHHHGHRPDDEEKIRGRGYP